MRRRFNCSICKVNPCSVSHRYCNVCHAVRMREWRKKHPLNEEQRMKMNCRSYLQVYIKRGKVKKLPCRVCGEINSQAHHSDYSKPLEVEWYCRVHQNK